MSDTKRGEGAVLNWRGPLLAAGIFAALFAILLIMAHQTQSKASDMGSSFREDPYGTSLMFDSYARAGYKVTRSQDEDTLSDQNALTTTAFFVGGRFSDDWRVQKGKVLVGEKLRRRLEAFLARGGRAVLVAPSWKLKSESQGWEVEKEWKQSGPDAGPSWISAEIDAMPADAEKMYLSSDAPWLKTNADWTVLYASAMDANAKPGSATYVYMAMRKAGKGELLVASQESFLLNEAIKTRPSPVLLDFLAGGRPIVWVDETLHGLRQDKGVLWLVHRYRLQAALLLFWATLLAVLWSMGGDLVRRPTPDQNVSIVRNSEGAGVAAQRLLQRSIAKEQLVAECWEQFRHRAPQHAQAISADPLYGPRLGTALAASPLVGYKHLRDLIAERRASAKVLARTRRDISHGSATSLETGPRNG